MENHCGNVDPNVKKKRIRSANFTHQEKETLLSLVLKYKHIVENKKTDHVSAAEKMQAWGKITKEFNALSPNFCKRNTESLKKFFENQKKEVRKQVAEEKKEIFVTGGGKKKDVKSDPNQDVLLSIMNTKTVFGLDNPFDCDDMDSNDSYREQDEIELELEADCDKEPVHRRNSVELLHPDSDVEKLISEVEEEENVPSTSGFQKLKTAENQVQWKKAISLKTPMSESLKRPHTATDYSETPSKRKTPLSNNRRRPTATIKALSSSQLAEKYEQLLDKRLVIADYEKKKLEKELEYQKKEHEMKMQLLKIQVEIEKKKLRAT